MTNNNYANYDKIVILYYRRFASGNFLANILCHNKNFAPKFVFDSNVPRYQSNTLDLSPDELFKTQIDLLKTTIPDNKEQCQEWWQYELGCAAFWCNNNKIFWDYDKETWTGSLRHEPLELLKQNKYCFIVAHNPKQYDCISSIFPRSTTIQLVNDSIVVETGAKLKFTSGYGPYVNPENSLLDSSIKFDIGSMLNKEQFFKNINSLLDCFNLPDKTLDPAVNEYFNRYTQLHFNI